ncbi:uncharacterized protein SPSC_05369 [Sporisorium scitamineum]|uniref:Uncharacterized protein n=1 Tax=Sporisorium scitamineum TaxID=49012 RepID=A0A0F7S000_9BASI|nr:hypothetical protein [Sporisorium scitamineum]CDU25476.1 uncharacterized protein SPSC_05369 [Sporisorium scitamineum]
MQATLSEYSRSEDDESVVTYDLSVTAISNRYLAASDVHMHKERVLHRYVSDSHLAASLAQRAAGADLMLDVRHSQQRLGQRRQLILEPSTYRTSPSGRAAQQTTVLKAGSYLEMFPMPNPRAASGLLRKIDVPKSLAPELEELDVTREADALEAAWDDESCTDGFTPRMDQSELFAEQPSEAGQANAMEDRFEVDALRRQVEQLQMALQLQSQQLARAESEKMQAHFRPRLSQHRPQQAAYLQGPPSPPPTGPPPQPSLSRGVQAVHPASMQALLQPRPSTAMPSTHYVPATPTADATPQRFYYERLTTASTVTHPFADRHEAETSHSFSPSPSTNPTLVDLDKFDHLNRKVAELEQLIEAINVNNRPAPLNPPQPPQTVEFDRTVSRATSTPDSAAFQFNTTRPPSLTPSSSIRSSTSIIPTPKETKGGKFAAVLGLKKSSTSNGKGNGSSLSVPSETSTRVSWSRKRTEKVAQPKVKVRQGPGRGRMVIRETAA